MEESQVLALTIPGIGLLITFLVICFKAGEWKGGVDRDRQNFNQFMIEISGKIDDIIDRLPSRRLLAEESPLGLTSFGREVGEEIGAKQWSANMVETLKPQVERKSPYEVQDFCFDFVKSKMELTPEQTKQVESSAYKHGVKREKVLEVLVIELRDALIDELELDK
ncbi:MAG: hypothetical protein OXG15_16390 [Gammaproteobacteria bacterium]|nr:hypothetical protein [Gammaproteobacteria bacterium]